MEKVLATVKLSYMRHMQSNQEIDQGIKSQYASIGVETVFFMAIVALMVYNLKQLLCKNSLL
jgi:hypothetical protein